MRSIVGVVMMMMSAVLVLQYIRELWINFTRPDQFDDLVKSEMRNGEFGGQEVRRNDRLFFSYPFLILGFGLMGWLLAAST
jgi:hypothetical protein